MATALTSQRLRAGGKAVVWCIAGFLLLTLGVLLFSTEAQNALAQIPAWSLWAFAAGVLLSNLLRMHRYILFAKRLRIHAPTPALYLYITAGMALIATPGKIGTALRLWLLHRRYHTPYRQSAPMLLMDLITDFLAMLLLMLLAIGLLGNAAGLGLALAVFIGLLTGVLTIFAFPAFPRAMVKILYALTGRRRKRLFAALLRLLAKLKTLFGWRTVLATTGLSFLGWVLLILSFQVVTTSLGLPLTFAMLTLVICAGTMLGSLTMLPGGLGGTEATMLALLATFGTPLPVALLLTLVFRTATLWLPTLVGFAALPFALRHANR